MNDKHPSKDENERGRRVQVWDLPVRIFHWLTVLLVAFSFITAELGGSWMPYHMWSGYILLALILFRVVWGFVGSRSARFNAFVRGPASVVRYARRLLARDTPKHLGHNPLGGWSVLAMLLSLLLQAATGLFANDDIFIEGPLYPWVSKATSDWLTRIHRFNQQVLLILIAIHVLAIFYYLIAKRDNLIKPMITGVKHWHGEAQPATASSWTAVLIAVLAGGAVCLLVR